MKILVLGGSGFLGSYVVDELVAAGHNVLSMDRYPERFRAPRNGVAFFQADFGNRGELEDVLKKGVHVVVHLISSTIPQSSNEDPIFDVQSNLVESIALIEMCVKQGVRKIVFVSSGGTVYGVPNTEVISEYHPVSPLCSYGIVKLAIEHYLKCFYDLHGLKFHVLRLSNPYGPRQDPTRKQGAPSVFMHNILTGKEISVWGDGEVIRDFLFVADFSKACLLAVESEGVGVLNIGSGVGLSINELISVTEEVVGVTAKINRLPSRGFDVPRVVLNCANAEKQLGWKPTTSMEEGVLSMFEWMSDLIRVGKL